MKLYQLSPFQIGNSNNTPFKNNNSYVVNINNLHRGFPFTDKIIPSSQHTMPPTGNNSQSASGIYPRPNT